MLTNLKIKIIFGVMFLVTTSSHAVELRWPSEPYSHYSNQEPLRDVIESLASSQGIPVVVSKHVDDIVSVSFNQMLPTELFDKLIKAYNLTWYYDGSTLFVYTIDELLTSTIKLNTITALDFQKSLQDLGIFDHRFPWRVVKRQNLIYFSGPPRMVTLVNEMAEQLDINQQQPENVIYSWVDEYGITHFSSAPPSGVMSEQVTVLTAHGTPAKRNPVIDVVQTDTPTVQ